MEKSKILSQKQPSHRIKIKKNFYEKSAWKRNMLVLGVDEVGRGCLAGPVVTAAVILPKGKIHRSLKDSKLMSPDERLKAYKWIIKHAHYALGIACHRTIDQVNIYQATKIAMKRSILQLLSTVSLYPESILIDAMPLTLPDYLQKKIEIHSFPFGESISSSIAAASIVAKVHRDALMQRLDLSIPGYLLGKHKGYSTKQHKTLVTHLSKSIIHRTSFLRWMNEEEEQSEQQRLC